MHTVTESESGSSKSGALFCFFILSIVGLCELANGFKVRDEFSHYFGFAPGIVYNNKSERVRVGEKLQKLSARTRDLLNQVDLARKSETPRFRSHVTEQMQAEAEEMYSELVDAVQLAEKSGFAEEIGRAHV